MSGNSALYTGSVFHRRFRPRAHELRYGAFWLYLDLDELEVTAHRLRLFSYNRANLLSFHDADHGSGEDRPLRPQIEAHLVAAGVPHAAHRIRVLSMPRVLGYSFNPLSVYYCFAEDRTLGAIVYEVTNTFGERHSYAIACTAEPGAAIHQRCDKQFYVSPFLDMDMRYEFSLTHPGATHSLSILGIGKEGPLISASLSASRMPLTDANLLRALVRHPLLTRKVTAAIHWEALRLWLKGLKVQPHPRPPSQPVTAVPLAAHDARKENHAS